MLIHLRWDVCLDSPWVWFFFGGGRGWFFFLWNIDLGFSTEMDLTGVSLLGNFRYGRVIHWLSLGYNSY